MGGETWFGLLPLRWPLGLEDRAGHVAPRPSNGVGAPELVVFVGLQASGKSTFYREVFAATHEHVSKDLFRHNKNRGRRQAQLVEGALRSGRSVVVDNTNPAPEDRAPLIELAQGYGARAVAYYFESETRASRERNGRREGKARVPDVAIYATAKKLVPPSRGEGFDEVYGVKIVEGSGFEVTLREARL